VNAFGKIIVAVVSVFAKATPENNLEVSFVGSEVNLFSHGNIGHEATYRAAVQWASRVAKMKEDTFGGSEVCQVSYRVETFGSLEDIEIGTEEYMLSAAEEDTEGGDFA
tara:strand:- start:57 stop:383 length:327 start_codon:yes stop_codon:yes gene_type:complete